MSRSQYVSFISTKIVTDANTINALPTDIELSDVQKEKVAEIESNVSYISRLEKIVPLITTQSKILLTVIKNKIDGLTNIITYTPRTFDSANPVKDSTVSGGNNHIDTIWSKVSKGQRILSCGIWTKNISLLPASTHKFKIVCLITH